LPYGLGGVIPLTMVAVLAHEPIQSRKPSGKFCPVLVVVGRKESKLLEKLVTASLLQPTILHFEELASDVRVRLTLGSFGIVISMPQAFADSFTELL
jgi:hypothetical protein